MPSSSSRALSRPRRNDTFPPFEVGSHAQLARSPLGMPHLSNRATALAVTSLLRWRYHPRPVVMVTETRVALAWENAIVDRNNRSGVALSCGTRMLRWRKGSQAEVGPCPSAHRRKRVILELQRRKVACQDAVTRRVPSARTADVMPRLPRPCP